MKRPAKVWKSSKDNLGASPYLTTIPGMDFKSISPKSQNVKNSPRSKEPKFVQINLKMFNNYVGSSIQHTKPEILHSVSPKNEHGKKKRSIYSSSQ